MAKKSAMKRNRQSIGRRMRNRVAKSSIKTAVKKFLTGLEGDDKSVSEADFRKVQKILDTAAGKGIIHPNLAARRKSRLAAKLSSVQKN